MSGTTSIEWATKSWNPTTGCTRVSAGCDNCYAFEWHDRRRFVPQRVIARAAGYSGASAARKNGYPLPFPAQYDRPYSTVQLLPQRLEDPRSWQGGERIFVDSMADLFHEAVPDEFLDRVFDVMDEVARHVYQVLTKRPARLARYVRTRYAGQRAPGHIWLGTSIEDKRVLARVDELRTAPATVRFLSCEPLLGPLTNLNLEGIHWLIAGGESGARRRPMDPAWVRELRDKSKDEGVAFFFKQWGGFQSKAGGRRLDGRLWSQFPVAEPGVRRGPRRAMTSAR